MCVFAVLPLFVICDTLQITNLDSYLYPLSPPYNFYYISPDHDRVFVIATLMSFLKDICKSAIHLVTRHLSPLPPNRPHLLHPSLALSHLTLFVVSLTYFLSRSCLALFYSEIPIFGLVATFFIAMFAIIPTSIHMSDVALSLSIEGVCSVVLGYTTI